MMIYSGVRSKREVQETEIVSKAKTPRVSYTHEENHSEQQPCGHEHCKEE